MKIPLVIAMKIATTPVEVFSLPNIIKHSDPVNDKQGLCMAQAIYFETRNQPIEAQLGVGFVIRNRVLDPRWPKTFCDVVNQNKHKKFKCQFSYMCDGKPEVIHDQQAWLLARKIARVVIEGKWYDVTGGSTHFIGKTKRRIEWVEFVEMKAQIQHVTFYYESPEIWGY